MRYRVLDPLAQLPLVGGPAIRPRACGRPRAVGQVAIVVTDIVGSTELARELGDDRFFDLVARHQAVVRLEAERGGALSIKPQGDGVFLVFASADDALVAARAIQRAFVDWPVATRAGVHTGSAIAAEGSDADTSYPAFARTADEIEVRVRLLIAQMTFETLNQRSAHEQ